MKLNVDSLECRYCPVVGYSDYAPETGRGGFYDGVVRVQLGATGGLIQANSYGGQGYGHHILSAAHCINPTAGSFITFELLRDGKAVDVRVDVPAGSDYQINHPLYDVNDDKLARNDVGVLKLVDQDPAFRSPNRLLVSPFTATQYELFPDVLHPALYAKTVAFAGYGDTGNGTTGATGPFDIKRVGNNTIDSYDDMVYKYDFDDGTPANNRFGDLGLGVGSERCQAKGDSGSPCFVDRKIVGVCSELSTPAPRAYASKPSEFLAGA